MELEGSLPCSHGLIFHGDELLAPRPTSRLEDHPLSAVRDCPTKGHSHSHIGHPTGREGV